MATTQYGLNAPETVKVWAMGVEREALKRTYLSQFMGTSKTSLVYRKDELTKGPGDRIRCGLRMQLTGDGVAGDETQEGNEERLSTYTDDLIINQLRHAVRSDGEMTDQRIPFSIREEARDGLADWWADRYDTIGFNHLCGYTPANSEVNRDGGNVIVAPTSTHHLWTEASTTADEDLDATGDEFDTDILDAAVAKAKTLTPMIRPIRVSGEDYYVAFIHPYQTYQLRTLSGSAWLDVQKAAMQGGRIGENPIFTGMLGIWNNVVLHEATRVTQGVDSSSGAAVANVRRGVLCGAQALTFGYGRKNRARNFTWKEETFDYGNQLGVSAGSIFGMKKAQYNSADFSTVVMSSYSPEPTGA